MSNIKQIILLIGINYINKPYQIRGSINDTIKLHEFFTQEGTSSKSITVMTDQTGGIYAPTKANIINQLNLIISSANSTTNPVNIFISYSGKGSAVNPSAINNTGSIYPLDFETNGVITDNYIKQEFINKLYKNSNLVCLFDCCNIHSILELKYEYTHNKLNKNINASNSIPACSVCAIYSCRTYRKEWNGATTISFISNYYQGITYEYLLESMQKWMILEKLNNIVYMATSHFVDLDTTVFVPV
jgi:hypothetical protein